MVILHQGWFNADSHCWFTWWQSNLSPKIHGYVYNSPKWWSYKIHFEKLGFGASWKRVVFPGLSKSLGQYWVGFSLDVGFKYFPLSHCGSKGLLFLAKNPRKQWDRSPNQNYLHHLTSLSWEWQHTVSGRNLKTFNRYSLSNNFPCVLKTRVVWRISSINKY